MLVLTRRNGESIIIGNSIRITVVDIASGGVRIGIDAPSEVSIYREEIYDEIAAVNKAALDDPPASGDAEG